MKEIVTFSVGVGARLLAIIVEKYGAWLLDKIGDGAELGLDLLQDLREFFRELLRWAATQICGRRVLGQGYEEDWHSRMYR